MVRVIVVIALIFLTGCFSNKRPQEIQIQRVNIPILYCPSPPTIERPILPIHKMTPQQTHNPGELVKHYKATIKILQGYALELEQVVNQYGKNSTQYEQVKQEILNKLKQDGIITPNNK